MNIYTEKESNVEENTGKQKIEIQIRNENDYSVCLSNLVEFDNAYDEKKVI